MRGQDRRTFQPDADAAKSGPVDYQIAIYVAAPQHRFPKPDVQIGLMRGDRGNAREAGSPKELAEASDIVMLCLTTSEVVEKVVYGDDGILAGIGEGAALIDFGTSIPASTRRIGADLAAKGAGMVDAPLGRTPAHAKDGLLNIMAAGDRETFDKVRPVLDQQGENVFYLGALGAGHVTKLINNFMGMTTVCTMSQAFAVADRSGVDLQQLYDIMSTGPSNSPFMGFCKNFAVDGVSDLGFSINNANKDLGYFLQMAEDLGTRVEIAEGNIAQPPGRRGRRYGRRQRSGDLRLFSDA